MRYVSTRGEDRGAGFREILLGGLMEDGGLAMPAEYPRLSAADLDAMRTMNYRELAFAVLRLFADDVPEGVLRALIDKTYTAEVYSNGSNAEEITPVRTLEPGVHLLELSNGPTLAFKDMAMQLLGNLFEWALAERGESLNVLGATSGDTGSSAEYAMRGKRGIRVFMLSPHGKMSAFQTAQMFTLMDENIHNLAVRGVFDDCQDVVKAVSNDLEFKRRYRIGTVNSINWARVVAQVVYYFKGYFAVAPGAGAPVDFAVPSGNFGNICAGHIARMMGLPIGRLILATNENDVLDEFFRTGIYRPRGTTETQQTSSPSMDISKASNFERFVFDLVGRDSARIRSLWAQGAFDLSGTDARRFGFVSGSSTHTGRLATIRRTWERYGVVVDPHTADGLKVGMELRSVSTPLICLETALPAKFAATIQEALGREPERPSKFDGIEALPQRSRVIDADAGVVKRIIEESVS
ncbi:MAG: threonine synthase [Acidobacteria bacterium]|nr:threonine synthase [Acidobacteriota bacterium]